MNTTDFNFKHQIGAIVLDVKVTYNLDDLIDYRFEIFDGIREITDMVQEVSPHHYVAIDAAVITEIVSNRFDVEGILND